MAKGGGRSELPGICGVCGAAPGLIALEANRLRPARRLIVCSDCFARRVREQRERRVTPVDGVPLPPRPTSGAR